MTAPAEIWRTIEQLVQASIQAAAAQAEVQALRAQLRRQIGAAADAALTPEKILGDVKKIALEVLNPCRPS